AQLLLAIPMKGLRACPTMPVGPHDSTDLPPHPVRHQDDAGRGVVLLLPQDDDAHLMVDVRDAQRAGEVPLPPAPLTQFLAHAGIDPSGQRRGLEDSPLVLQLAVELERADVAPPLPAR